MLGSFRKWTFLVAMASTCLGLDNRLARTPQMGWNNWNSLGCDVSQQLLVDTADLLIRLGLRDLGYEYVLLDDCWSDGRDENGRIKVDTRRFPQGMKWVAEQLHNAGLLYGMYSSAGHLTCARYEGSLDYEKADAESWASWGVDYLKYDNCYSAGRHGSPEASFNRYKTMGDALKATGRNILYSLCNWGEDYVHYWDTSIANSWRISGDIYDSFTRPDALCSCTEVDPASPWCVAPGSRCSVLTILNRVAPYADRGQPGGWHDLDMLEVGNGGMTDEEYKAHFALWAALKSPLIIGADIRHLSPSALTILNNPAIIAINQDPVGRPATRIWQDVNVPKDRFGVGEIQIWSGPLSGDDQLLILLNAADKDLTMVAELEDIFAHDGPGGSAPQNAEAWDVHDLWSSRMTDSSAAQILQIADQANESQSAEKLSGLLGDWYNATILSYKEGLKNRDPRLLGQKVSEIKSYGALKVKVPRHSAKVYRLISQAENPSRRYKTTKDEL